MNKKRRKSVLLICNYFAPDHTIAAVRTSKLAKYLRLNGYEVKVITEQKETVDEDVILKKDTEGIKVSYARHSGFWQGIDKKYYEMTQPHRRKRFNNLKNRYKVNPKTGKEEFYPFETAYPILGSLDYVMGLMRQYDLFLSIKKELRQRGDFDYVITSYGDALSVFAGRYYHKHHRKAVWIFDIRDAVYRYKFTPSYVSWIAKGYEKQVWREADCITGVSKGICRRVPRRYQNKVHCLTNGYDVSDREGLKTSRLDTRRMTFTYTGSMYGGLIDLSVFFQCVRDAVAQGKVDGENIEFHFAGNAPAYEIFKSQARKYRLEKNCISHGKMSRKDALQLQQQSDALLVASYDYQDNQGGVITGKALEYMSAGKPVIALIMGDIEHSELADIVRNTNIGIAYEDAHKAADYEKLLNYVCSLYGTFVKTRKTQLHLDQNELRKYDYGNLCKRLIKIMNQIEK